jgi:RHS repeat-associated protein
MRTIALLLLGAVTAAVHADVGDYADTFHCRDEPVNPGSSIRTFQQAMAACTADTKTFESTSTPKEQHTVTTSCGVHDIPGIDPAFNLAGDLRVSGEVTAYFHITTSTGSTDSTWRSLFQCLQSPDPGDDNGGAGGGTGDGSGNDDGKGDGNGNDKDDTPTEAQPDQDKAAGEPPEGNGKGDPIDSATGNVYRTEMDLRVGPWLSVARTYNSLSSDPSSAALGPHWTGAWARAIQFTPQGRGGIARVRREDGKVVSYVLIDEAWQGEADVQDELSWRDTNHQPKGWTYRRADHVVESYNAQGQLTAVTGPGGQSTTLTYSGTQLTQITDAQGRSLSLDYDAQGHLHTVTAPDGSQVVYTYDAAGQLVSATRPGSDELHYLYDETEHSQASAQGLLTGIQDAHGERLATYDYQADGRAVRTQLAGGAFDTTLQYHSDGTTTVTDARGVSVTLHFSEQAGVKRVSEQSGPCEACGLTAQTIYNEQGLPTQLTDFNGRVTTLEYNDQGKETQRTQAAGTDDERHLLTTWFNGDPKQRDLTDAQGQLIRRVATTYDPGGSLTMRCQIDPLQDPDANCIGLPNVGIQRWLYNYCPSVLEALGCPYAGVPMLTMAPDNTTTQYSYYLSTDESGCGTPEGACHHRGDLYQINHHSADTTLSFVTTNVAYDKNGHVTRQRDPNGVTTAYTYNAQGAPLSRSVLGPDGHVLATTQFAYNDRGDLVQSTDADGVVMHLDYDAIHRLIRITDAQGNRLERRLDSSGKLTQVQVIDAQGNVIRTNAQTYNTLGQLATVIDGLNHTVFDARADNSYDADGNLLHSTDGLGIQRQQSYDALNRLIVQLDNAHGTDNATADTQSTFAYDTADALAGVSDPDGLPTTYERNGLGQITATQSPDTGTTRLTYDDGGRVHTRTNAKGITSTYSYDGIGRLIGISYPEATQNLAYHYDEADSTTGCASSYPVGQLTRIVQGDIATVYCYDAQGRITRKQQITKTATDTTAYTSTPAGRVNGITYPDDSQVSYTRDSNGHISGMQVVPHDGSAREVVSHVTYQPFGPIASYTLGNGQTITRTYDASGQLTDIASPALNLHYTRNAMGEVTGINDGNASRSYDYDALYRLTAAHDATGNMLESYTYNKTGDRTSKTGNGLATGDYGYQANTHWLTSTGNTARSYDETGNTTALSDAGSQLGFGYDDAGRMTVVQRDGNTIATYVYDGLGQRIGKIISDQNTRYGYNENSQLIAETIGDTSRDYLWLDATPVAVIDNDQGKAAISYVHADALNTPRAIINESGAAIWTWAVTDSPFGEDAPSSGTGYVYKLRFPGQYYDAETGLFNNVHRDFDSSAGRYIQSDPIGLLGGISTYAYTGDSPLSHVDLLGEAYFALRPLGRLPWLGPASNNALDAAMHDQVAHEQLFFEDGNTPANLGFFPDGVHSDMYDGTWHKLPREYNDCVMRKAVTQVTPGDYKLFGNNCQTWSDKVREEYNQLILEGALGSGGCK